MPPISDETLPDDLFDFRLGQMRPQKKQVRRPGISANPITYSRFRLHRDPNFWRDFRIE
jgi:hypothetical protein